MVAKNGGSAPLEPGDVAEIQEIAPSGAPDRQPVLHVGPSRKADSTAVAGVSLLRRGRRHRKLCSRHITMWRSDPRTVAN